MAGDDMSANVAELVEAEFGIVVAVSLKRFKSNGWFAVGLTETECPRCRSRMQGYRMPYTTKAGLTYHYEKPQKWERNHAG